MKYLFKKVLTSAISVFTAVALISGTVGADDLTDRELFTRDLERITSEFKTEYPQLSVIIDKTLSDFINDHELYECYLSSPKDALDIFERAVEIDVEINISSSNNSRGVGNVGSLGQIYYCNVDSSIIQETTSWCGPASAQMAISGMISHCPSQLIISEMPTQTYIADQVQDEGITYVYLMTSYLSSVIKSDYSKYTYKQITSSVTKDDIIEYIKHSLAINRPVLLHAKPYQAFDYYDGVNSTAGHYIVVEEYNTYTEKFTVSDCTYLSAYQGRHFDITIDEIYDSLYNTGNNVTGRYLIYA